MAFFVLLLVYDISEVVLAAFQLSVWSVILRTLTYNARINQIAKYACMFLVLLEWHVREYASAVSDFRSLIRKCPISTLTAN